MREKWVESEWPVYVVLKVFRRPIVSVDTIRALGRKEKRKNTKRSKCSRLFQLRAAFEYLPFFRSLPLTSTHDAMAIPM